MTFEANYRLWYAKTLHIRKKQCLFLHFFTRYTLLFRK